MRVLQRVKDPTVRVIYLTAVVVGVAYGVSIALTALRMHALGFGKTAIGSLAAVFASGIVVASLPMGPLLQRVPAKRVLMTAIAGYGACVFAFAFVSSPWAIAAIRFFDGACSVATWIGLETVLLRRAEARHKAYVMSLYAIAVAIGYVTGPLVARAIVSIAPMHVAFVTSSVLAMAAAFILLVLLDEGTAEKAILGASRAEDHAPQGGALPIPAILTRIKTSLFATFSYGYFQASVVLFLPLFLIERKGIAESRTILIPAFFAGGMLLFSNYAGKVGDRVGHLSVMRILGAVGAATIALFVWLESYELMCLAIFVAGATLASISPVSLAFQGVVVDADSYGRANSLYNAAYALGMLLGPPISSAFYARLGGGPMLLHLAALWACFVGFTVVYAKDDPAARGERNAMDVMGAESKRRSAEDA